MVWGTLSFLGTLCLKVANDVASQPYMVHHFLKICQKFCLRGEGGDNGVLSNLPSFSTHTIQVALIFNSFFLLKNFALCQKGMFYMLSLFIISVIVNGPLGVKGLMVSKCKQASSFWLLVGWEGGDWGAKGAGPGKCY